MSYLSSLKVKDADGNIVNPAEEESIQLLRRIVKLLESNATVDSYNRQKVVVDAVAQVYGAYAVSSGGTNYPINGAPAYYSSTLYPIPTWECPVDQRWRIINETRVAFATGVRPNLSFS